MRKLAGTIALSDGWKRFAIAVLAGAVAALMFAPFSFLFAGFVSFSVLTWLIDGAAGDPDRGLLRRLWPSFFIGWAFGLGYFVAGVWWTANAMLVEADQFAWAIPLAALGLPAYLAIFYGLATLIARLFWTDGVVRIVALAGAFAAAEWARGFVFTGFPWNAVGQGLMPFPLMMQSLSVVGGHVIDFAAVLIFAAPAVAIVGRGGKIAVSLATILLSAHLSYGVYGLYLRPPLAETDRIVRIVQPSISQSDKLNDAERLNVFEAHLSLSARPPASGSRRPDYIVWPETSIPFILTENPDALQRIADILEDGQVLLAGAVRTEPQGAGQEPLYYNSIYAIDSQGQIINAADKVHLVPFGEYLPFENVFRQFDLSAVAAMPGGFAASARRRILTMPDGLAFLPMVCYEIVFSDEIHDDEIASSSVILNVTNDEWFGRSPGPWQHFFQARLQAVQTGLPVIRAANSGISAFIDARGRSVAALDFGTNGFIDATIPSKDATFMTQKERNFLFATLEFAVLVIAIFARLSFIFKRN